MKNLILAGLCTFAALSSASATTFTLTFEGLGDGSQVLNYYNGGFGLASDNTTQITGGTNFGVSFNTGAITTEILGGCDFTRCDFANETSPDTAVYFVTSPTNGATGSFTMNIAGGFTGGFSAFYSNPEGVTNGGASISFYDQVNGGGSLIGTLNLAQTPTVGDGGVCDTNNPSGFDFCDFVLATTSFSGTALSAVFTGPSNQVLFDNISFGPYVPPPPPDDPSGVPEPSTFVMLGLGVLGTVASKVYRRS